MADNVAITAGSGTNIATDDVAGVHYQRVKLVNGTLDATDAIGGDATNGLDVDVTRVSGNVAVTLAAGATAIAKAEDVASADADVGVPAMAIRKATPANTSGTDGDYEMLQMSAGRLWASATIDAALPAGTNAIGKLAANDGVDVGDVTINNASGASAVNIQDGGNSITVDGTVTASIAAGATTIAKAEDVASADADVGVPAMAVRKATPANTSGTDGDYEMLQISAGRLWVSAVVDSALPAGTNAIGKLAANSGVTIGAVELAAAQTLATLTTCTTLTGGGIAHDGADSGNPHKIGAKATTSLSGATVVSAADRTDLFAGTDGVLITRPYCNQEDIVTGNASNTDGTSTQCIAAQAAGIKTYLTTIILTNMHASSNIYVEIKDGTTVKMTVPVPAAGGVVVNLPVPLPGTAATAWNFDPSAATTTVYCSMIGYKSKI